MLVPNELYSPQVRDHIEHPRNRGEIAAANGRGTDENPVCGDIMTVWVNVQNNCIQSAGFEVKGCEPSIAAGSAITELVTGIPVHEAKAVSSNQVEELLGGLPKLKRHCAHLAVSALRAAIKDYEARL